MAAKRSDAQHTLFDSNSLSLPWGGPSFRECPEFRLLVHFQGFKEDLDGFRRFRI